MTRNLKFFFISFLITSFLCWGLNLWEENLEEFFFWQKTRNLSLRAEMNQEFFEKFRPFRNWHVGNLEIEAKAGISVFIDHKGEEKVLFAKEVSKRLPIASLTKLMTAMVAMENYDPLQVVKIEKILPEDNGELKLGEKFTVKDLLYFLLISSNNTAGNTLAEIMGRDSFLFLMNKKAKALGMEDTFFFNPTGLDPNVPQDKNNFSTAKDLVILAKIISENQFLTGILLTPEIEIYSQEDFISHKLKNTNELLKKEIQILAGKTGWTPQARGCLAIVTKAPKKKGKIISVILGSEKRFEEMERLIRWVEKAYIF